MPHPRTFDDSTLEQACRTARLELDPGRRARLGAQLEAVYCLIDAMDAVDLAETPPATAFDPRWE
jgi:Asp-tRNA(Asn)/Glu-tRNA(Gln) amidotransferase C subunit